MSSCLFRGFSLSCTCTNICSSFCWLQCVMKTPERCVYLLWLRLQVVRFSDVVLFGWGREKESVSVLAGRERWCNWIMTVWRLMRFKHRCSVCLCVTVYLSSNICKNTHRRSVFLSSTTDTCSLMNCCWLLSRTHLCDEAVFVCSVEGGGALWYVGWSGGGV